MESSSNEFGSFLKDAGLIWGPSPEIYGGFAGFYTYGPLGKLLKNKVENSLRKTFNENEIREIEGPTILPDIVWEASGHLKTFNDKVIVCSKCKKKFRPDKLIEEHFDISADSFSNEKLLEFIKENKINCPDCKSKLNEDVSRQSLMIKTFAGGKEASLRPETATGTYLPFLRYYNYFRRKLPFGVFQIGKAYRNEISPRNNVLRGREFTQAEAQIFVDPKEKNNWEKFEEIKEQELPLWNWEEQKENKNVKKVKLKYALENKILKNKAYAWCIYLGYSQLKRMGFPEEKIRLRQHFPEERAFYADDAWDLEIKLENYGWLEVCGIHDRKDYDLKQHSKFSKIDLQVKNEEGEKFYPNILEIAFGVDRLTYSLISIFYEKKEEENGKTTFKIPYNLAPIDLAIFPLMKKPELIEITKKIKKSLEEDYIIEYDKTGSIGKRYLRAAIKGIPLAVTIDFDSIKNKDVTLRDRDSEKQVRIKIKELKKEIEKRLRENSY